MSGGRYVSDSEDYDSDSDYDHGKTQTLRCQKCPNKPTFTSKRAFKEHMIENKKHDYCEKCEKDFDSYDDLIFHKMKSPLHIICVDCKKDFQSSGGLGAHRKQYHRTAQPLPCPGCKQEFTNASGLLQHLEGDTCESGMGKAALHRRIGEAQKALAEASLAEGDTQGAAALKVVDYVSIVENTGDTPPMHETAKSFKATIDEHNIQLENWDDVQKLYICREGNCRKKFQSLQAMIQHKASDTHAIKNFRCAGCLNTFKSASALSQHIESQSCKMGSYEAAKKMVENIASGW